MPITSYFSSPVPVLLCRKKNVFWLRKQCWMLCLGVRSRAISGHHGTGRTSSVRYVKNLQIKSGMWLYGVITDLRLLITNGTPQLRSASSFSKPPGCFSVNYLLYSFATSSVFCLEFWGHTTYYIFLEILPNAELISQRHWREGLHKVVKSSVTDSVPWLLVVGSLS